MAQVSKEKALEIIDEVIDQTEYTSFNKSSVTPEITECIGKVRIAISGIFGSNSSHNNPLVEYVSPDVQEMEIQKEKDEEPNKGGGLL